ncbi:membrane-bound lytic murein transglycosylase D [Lewinella aquimaris]|uniref:Membrane-bound lytic murein transglycosylase D n=1 Tax=Neolewinella aquimaris TaxID=1835722 RepID=A0A840EAS0_9BACT|nr:lytic transglycosylase domain-containing protein [Neolewinella aquimaris]MBB4079108.1 membrane-bound lytic murein transglycosylase D [Neolewinella aquimaris]
MSKLQRTLCQWLLLLLVAVPSIAVASLSSPVKFKSRSRAQMVHRLERLDLPPGIPTSDAFVQRKINDYMGGGGSSTERMLGRANQYFPIFDFYLRKHDLPASLKYLAVAESMLVPNAVSSARAAGLWQLMPATAREMGLRVDGIIDERLDLHRSTEAAVLMLKDLHAQFGDWHLALAAYNCGAGRVRKAIRSAGSRQYDKASNYLPRETRRYVAAYLAAAYAVNYYDDHGLNPMAAEGVESIRVYTRMSLAKIARECDVRLSTLIRMNPTFVQHYIPASEQGYRLRVPQEQKYRVQQFIWGRPNLVELPFDENLVAANEAANMMGFDPKFTLLGISASRLAYRSPVWSLRLLEERMLLGFLTDYRAFASL